MYLEGSKKAYNNIMTIMEKYGQSRFHSERERRKEGKERGRESEMVTRGEYM